MRRILFTSAALAATVVIAHPSYAQPLALSSPGSSNGVAAVGKFHAYDGKSWSGRDRWFEGNAGQCKYVGDNWNDEIESARTESGTRVELWDNYNCTGGAIVIDRTGYSKIGNWVSAFRVTRT
ncbi:hypothetical protein GCM10010420_12180 [Streptomyces glaucosporus]|uniref:Peptidase inhibitor family I36 n=1 Tax=Streptomyces glaucosporus TaxID=284044 RepID=A0ABN3HY68_9ACTN